MGELGVRPQNILAVTFTNKAANEMLHRVDQLVPPTGGYRPWIGTFHSTSLRILRRYADRLGYTKSFAVYDTADQLTLVRRCMRELNVNDDAFPTRSILHRTSSAKNELINPVDYEKTNLDFFGARVAEVYRQYQKKLREFDAMDFDDLIGKYVELLEQHEDVRDELHERFQHLLIDEYQDTNRAQYVLVKLLAGKHGNIVAVGDEDQSIYRFRGADINNILNFERDFPGAKIIKLEQNYRSTGNILDAARNASLPTSIEGELRFLPSRAARAFAEFRDIIHDLQRAATNPLPDFVDYVLVRSGYRRMLQESRDVQDESRLENLDELINSAREYYENNPQAAIGDYLDSLTLMSDLDRY